MPGAEQVRPDKGGLLHRFQCRDGECRKYARVDRKQKEVVPMEIIAALAFALTEAGFFFSALEYVELRYKRVAARCK